MSTNFSKFEFGFQPRHIYGVKSQKGEVNDLFDFFRGFTTFRCVSVFDFLSFRCSFAPLGAIAS